MESGLWMKITSNMIKFTILIVILMILISCNRQELLNTEIESTSFLDSTLQTVQTSSETANDKTQELNVEIASLKSQIQILNDEILELDKSSSYEIFYGEWEVSDRIYIDPVPIRGVQYDETMLKERSESILKDISVKEIKFTDETAVINRDKVIDNIRYKLIIIPADDNYKLHFTMTLKDIGLLETEANYFVFVKVESRDIYSFWGNSFFIKNKNTIIMLGDGYCVEYNRTSYDGGSEEVVIIGG